MQWNEFVLYCHILPKDKPGLLRVRRDIQHLLASNQGLMVLFVDTGLPDLLKMIHPIKRDLTRIEAKREKQRLKDDLLGRSPELREGEEFGRQLESQLLPNVRVLTALDLVDVFGEMSAVEDLKKFLIGMRGEIRYDTPKFIESATSHKGLCGSMTICDTFCIARWVISASRHRGHSEQTGLFMCNTQTFKFRSIVRPRVSCFIP